MLRFIKYASIATLCLSIIADPIHVGALYEHDQVFQSTVPRFNGQFGYKLDSHDSMVLMAEYSENVFLYDQDSGEYIELAIPEARKLFEVALDIRDDIIAVGYISTHYDTLEASGIAYLLNTDGEFLRTIYPPDPINWGHFGASVFIRENEVYVGEAWADYIEIDEGKVHRFTTQGDFIDSMVAPESNYATIFGARLDGNNEKLIITELNGVHGMLKNGEVHIYNRDLRLERTLTSTQSGLNDFGAALAVTDEYLLVGESIAEVDGLSRAGLAYLFDFDGNLVTTFKSPNPAAGGLFGFSVAINSEYVAIGEPRADGTKVIEGAVHLYSLDGSYLETLNSFFPESNSEFGKSVAFSDDALFVGQPGASVDGLINAGRVLSYTRSDKQGWTRIDLTTFLAVILVSFLFFYIRARSQRVLK